MHFSLYLLILQYNKGLCNYHHPPPWLPSNLLDPRVGEWTSSIDYIADYGETSLSKFDTIIMWYSFREICLKQRSCISTICKTTSTISPPSSYGFNLHSITTTFDSTFGTASSIQPPLLLLPLCSISPLLYSHNPLPPALHPD